MCERTSRGRHAHRDCGNGAGRVVPGGNGTADSCLRGWWWCVCMKVHCVKSVCSAASVNVFVTAYAMKHKHNSLCPFGQPPPLLGLSSLLVRQPTPTRWLAIHHPSLKPLISPEAFPDGPAHRPSQVALSLWVVHPGLSIGPGVCLALKE